MKICVVWYVVECVCGWVRFAKTVAWKSVKNGCLGRTPKDATKDATVPRSRGPVPEQQMRLKRVQA